LLRSPLGRQGWQHPGPKGVVRPVMGGWLQLGIVALYGGLLALERRAVLQAMFSRPLVAATGMGLLLGDPTTGLWLGVLLELFHLGGAALGAAMPEHETLSATSTSAAAILMAGG